MALASTIGTGNIIGVGTVIASGGPGAFLWMLLTGAFGIATRCSKSLIAILAGLVVIGGLKWIARILEELAPVMSVIYVIGCIVILMNNYCQIFSATQLVFSTILGWCYYG